MPIRQFPAMLARAGSDIGPVEKPHRASRPPAAPFPTARRVSNARLSVTAVRNYVEAMRSVGTPEERTQREVGLSALLGVMHPLSGDDDAFFLGKQCLLDEDPPSDDLFCKGTGRRGSVYIPARIINGKKGDVILLPGGASGMVGDLLLRLDPPQNYSHCGIMSGNFYKLRHATASEEWLNDERRGVNFMAPDEMGSDGFVPDSLRYIWPGTVDQTVEQAFSGSNFLYHSADGKRKKLYKIQAFSDDPAYFMRGRRRVAFPLVLKPDPLLEGLPEFAHLRPTLADVAERAKAIRGHYRLFCYSNGAISFRDDTAHRAPDRGPQWWASGTRPMVCSTLILAAIEDLGRNVRMEGRSMFVEETDLDKVGPTGERGPDENALVDPLTRDGLYLYTEEERGRAADSVYDHVYGKALETAKALGRDFADAPSDFGNQVTNAFAFDYVDREFDDEDAKDSEKWKAPGIGRSVSPDDMLYFWDAPRRTADGTHGLYGTAVRMDFRDGDLDEREIGTWAIREKMGKLKVTVLHRGGPVPGADVKAGGRVAVTAPDGTRTMELPEGSYAVEAGTTMGDLYFEGRGGAQVKDGATVEIVIELADPPEFERIVVMGGHVRIKDQENVGEDEILDGGFKPAPSVVRIGPLHRHHVADYVVKWGGEIRVEAHYELTWNPDLSVTVDCNVKLYEGVTEDTDDLDGERGASITIFKDQQDVPLTIFVGNDAEGDDDYVRLTTFISNFVA